MGGTSPLWGERAVEPVTGPAAGLRDQVAVQVRGHQARQVWQGVPPVMLSVAGERMLRLGGRAVPEDAFARRVQVLREAAGDRLDVMLS